MGRIQRKMARRLLTPKRFAHARQALLIGVAAVGAETLLLVISIHTLPGVLVALVRALPAIHHLVAERGSGVIFSFLILLVQAALWPVLFALVAWKSATSLLRLRRERLKPRHFRQHLFSWHPERQVDTEKMSLANLSRVQIPRPDWTARKEAISVTETITFSPALVSDVMVSRPLQSDRIQYGPPQSDHIQYRSPQEEPLHIATSILGVVSPPMPSVGLVSPPVQPVGVGPPRVGYLRIGTDSRSALRRAVWPNEDSLVTIQGSRNAPGRLIPFGLIAIADGGRYERGWEASRLATQTLLEVVRPTLAVSGNLPDIALMSMLVKGLREANRIIYQRNVREATMMRTTLSAILAIEGKAYVVNAGDSRVYHYSPRKGLAQITGEYPSATRVEFASEQTALQPGRTVLSDHLGIQPGISVHSFVVKLDEGDALLLCSDGLWKMVDAAGIERIMSNTSVSLVQTATLLVQTALRGNGEDTASAIVASVAAD
jgi:PPM family protein phosphatase